MSNSVKSVKETYAFSQVIRLTNAVALPAMFFVVVLLFGVACLAFPTSEDGTQCLARCLYESSVRNASETVTDSVSVAEHNRAHRLLKRDIFYSAKYDMCEPLIAFAECSKSCLPSREDAVVQQLTRVAQKECSPSVPKEHRDTFLLSAQDLFHKMTSRATRCEKREPMGDEALCKNVAECRLGIALDAVKADYPTDVVTFVADEIKVMFTLSLKDTKSPPEACSFFYEPYMA